jgi:hypothetical protein
MASSIPTQARAVDPFSSYHSNTVNRLTRMLTEGNDVLLSRSSLEVTADSTSPVDHVIVSPGVIFKDDVMINVSEEFRLDFTDSDHYASFGAGFNESGYYYVCLEYNYVKSKPAPVATIKIIKPSQKATTFALSGAYVFLKCVSVIDVGISKGIDVNAPLYDYDPEDPTIKRQYVKFYAGGEVTLPTFDIVRDASRIIYVTSEDMFYYGFSTGWRQLILSGGGGGGGGGSTAFNIDTTGLEVGDICYIDDLSLPALAIATAVSTCGDFVVSAVGGTGGGEGTIAGYVTAKVQTGIVINPGDQVFLSSTQAGRVTNVSTAPVYQMLGRAVTGGNSSVPITMIFSAKLPLAQSIGGQITSWTLDAPTGLYYSDIDISALSASSVVLSSWFNNSTSMEIKPAEVELRSSGDTVRVYMANNSTTINYLISVGGAGSGVGGGGGGGGGGGTTDHSLLTNLGFAQSGHTGFSANPHGASDHTQVLALNPHSNTSHSVNYIVATDVTYNALVNTSSVGTGATQVARGNHAHAEYVDIPSNEIILFEKDTAVTGYTLLTDVNDNVVYVTSGSSAGGETGGTLKTGSTWTQPGHQHTIGSHGHSASGSGTVSTYHRHVLGNAIAGSGFSSISTGDGTQAYESDYQGSSSAAVSVSVSVGGSGTLTDNASATANTWRPTGRNFTRQRKI